MKQTNPTMTVSSNLAGCTRRRPKQGCKGRQGFESLCKAVWDDAMTDPELAWRDETRVKSLTKSSMFYSAGRKNLNPK
jgi:hypothetical protein